MKKQTLTDRQQEIITNAKHDLISIFDDICTEYGFNSSIAQRLDTILIKLEIYQNHFE